MSMLIHVDASWGPSLIHEQTAWSIPNSDRHVQKCQNTVLIQTQHNLMVTFYSRVGH